MKVYWLKFSEPAVSQGLGLGAGITARDPLDHPNGSKLLM